MSAPFVALFWKRLDVSEAAIFQLAGGSVGRTFVLLGLVCILDGEAKIMELERGPPKPNTCPS